MDLPAAVLAVLLIAVSLVTPTLGPGDTWTRPADGMTMVYVPAGQFEMGSDDGDVDYAMQLCSEYLANCERGWFENEQPVHTVALDGFWIDQYEVSNAQYQKCVEAGECQAPTMCYLGELIYREADKADHPAVCVDWQGAQGYCEWVGGRLPTEAEWEYAARGSAGNVFPWYEQTAPVGGYPDGASWCGAEDMAGNVLEWTADWYGPYSSEFQTNPTGPASGDSRVLRGGSWGILSDLLRCAKRIRYGPSIRYDVVWFRCVNAIRSP